LVFLSSLLVAAWVGSMTCALVQCFKHAVDVL
jgi:hypothetical protein